MKIGDNVFVHGYVDEIRTDTVIIRNNGGYFGTVPGEIVCGEMPERKKGEWIEKGINVDKTHNIVCSNCGEGYKTRGHAKSISTRLKWKFCPSCGADMRGTE